MMTPDNKKPCSETRAQRVERIRSQIASGEYDTPERLEAALESFVGQHAAPGSPKRVPHFRR